MTSKIERILARIQHLVALAEHPNTPPAEADLARQQAERLMNEYRIEEEEVIAASAETVIAPVWREFDLQDWQHHMHFPHLFVVAMRHSGCQPKMRYDYEIGRGHVLKADVVGYESDMRYAEYLFTAAAMVYTTHVIAAHDPKQSEAENVYRMRSSGRTRAEIATALWGSAPKDGNAHGKVAAIYRAECLRRGEDPTVSGRQVSAKTFRKVFAERFVVRFRERLLEVKNAAGEMGGAVVLHGRQERVDEAFYERYPQYRPAPDSRATYHTVDCDACRRSRVGQCKQHRWTQADERRWQRENASPTALAAKKAAAAAVDDIRMARVERKGRLDESPATSIIREIGT